MNAHLDQFWKLAAQKARFLDTDYDTSQGSPVFTVDGRYTTRGWTEWTQGFQYGIPLLVFSATGDEAMLELGKRNTMEKMGHHVTHFGVHDHGFNNLSTYGNLLRDALAGKFQASAEELAFYKMALSASASVQAKRWTPVREGGFIHSFNGPHSLFIDTMRTLRILLVAHRLGHRMLEEHDAEVILLERALVHGLTTARHAIWYGEDRDSYDVRGRTAHESIFNTTDGMYRCPNSQQGFSGYTTWTRGLAWAMLGFSEFLEFLDTEHGEALPEQPQLVEEALNTFERAARATCDFYLDHSGSDGIPYWDTGAPRLHMLGRYQDLPADPFNAYEPVDSSAAAIAAQGLIRLGKYLEGKDEKASGHYLKAGLSVLETLLSEVYLSAQAEHQGILLHSVYHHPNGWDHIPEGQKVPCGESSLWGDYHMTELCYTAHRLLQRDHYTFFENL